MARGRKKRTESSGPRRLPNSDEVRRAVEEASRNKAHAAEYQGLMGQSVKAFTERYGVHRKAFSFVRSLNDMEDQKRQSCLRDVMILADRLGYFDQSDLFDDLGDRVKEAAEDAAIGRDTAEMRAARTAEELQTAIPEIDTTVSERLADQQQWDAAGEVAKAKESVARKKSAPTKSADHDLAGEIDAAVGSKLN